MEKAKLQKDIIAMIVLILFSVFARLYLVPAGIKKTAAFSSAGGVSSRTFPSLIALAVGALSLIHLIITIKKYISLRKGKEKLAAETADPAFRRKEVRRQLKTVAVFILFALYGYLFITLGFAVPSLTALPLCLFLLGSRDRRHYAGTLVFAAIVYVLFRYGLGLNILLFWF